MHAYHLVARHGEHAEWIVVAEVSFECERKVREVVERLHTVRRDTCRIERFAKMWNLGVGALQRLLQSIELQRRELGARHAFGAAIEHECSIADCSWRRHDLTSVGACHGRTHPGLTIAPAMPEPRTGMGLRDYSASSWFTKKIRSRPGTSEINDGSSFS